MNEKEFLNLMMKRKVILYLLQKILPAFLKCYYLTVGTITIIH